MPKPDRRKRIGDPLKKFKQPRGQTWWTAQRKFLERTMEEDHRAGVPMRASMYKSHGTGLPDVWFFQKARQLGYKIENEAEFAKAQLNACFKTPDRLEQFADTFVHVLSLLFSQKEMDSLGLDFRDKMLATMRREQAKGKPITFGMGDGNKKNPRKSEFVAGNEGRLVTWTEPDEQEKPAADDRGPSQEVQEAERRPGVSSGTAQSPGTHDGGGSSSG